MQYVYDYPMPAVTVDCIIYRKSGINKQDVEVLLIKRAGEPYKDQWALPGGYIEIDEELDDAAKRELFEEIGIIHNNLQQLFTVGTVGRDPRQRTISIIYSGLFNSETMIIKASDDAKAAEWFDIDKLPPLAFDHNEVILKAKNVLSF